MNLKLLSNHKLVGTREVIGRNLENKANYFIIAIPNELLDYSIYIEFQKSKEKYSSSAIKIIDGIITYPILNSLLDENKVTIQVVARKDDIIWKSQMLSFDVDGSINASESYEEEYPDFIGDITKQVANKQDKLISGVNIKTINGEDILGSGNIEIKVDDAYTKEETDELLDAKADKSTTYTKTETNDLLNNKADKTEIPTKTSQLNNDSNFQTKAQVDEGLNKKVDKVDGKGLSTNDYTDEDKTIVSNVTSNLNNKANKDDVYTKTETDDTFATKEFVLERDEGKKPTYVVDTINDIKNLFNVVEEDDHYVLFKNNKMVLVGTNILIKDLSVPDYWVSSNYSLSNDVMSFLSPLETTKVDLSDYDTKEEVDEKLETKLDKNNDVTSSPFAYIKNADGSQNMLAIDSSGKSAYSLVQRDASGRIVVANPVGPSNAVNKGYLGVLDTDIIPNSSTSYLSLGSSSKTFATAYVTTLRVTNLYPLGSSTSAIIFSSKDTKLYTNLLTQKILPSDNLAYDIGDSNSQYGNIYGKIIYQDNKQVATKEETNNLLDEKANKTDVYTKEETDAKLDAKADKNDIPTKTSQLENDSEYVNNARLTAGLSTKADREKVYTKEEVDEKVDAKQDTLVSGTNIKTINGESVLGSGDIEITTDLSNYYTKKETNDLLDEKVDKVDGKQLSTNDYTDEDKNIVSNVTTNLNLKANKTDIPTKTSELTNDSNFQNETQVQALINSAIISGLSGDY